MKITFLISGSVRSNFVYRGLALARALRKQGHEISIIAPSADKYNDFSPEKIDSMDGITILQPFQFATKRLEINLLPYLFGAAKMALKVKSDFIYIYKPTPVNVIGFIVKFLRKTPVVVDMDDLGSEVMKIEGHPWYRRKLVEWSEHFALKHADRLVVASTYLFEKYHKEFPDMPIHLMPNGVEADWFSPAVPSEEKKRIVFMGSINRRTIVEPLFDIFPEIVKRHPDAKLLIIGAGSDFEYFKRKAEGLNISKYITFTGWLSLEDARSRLHSGDIGYNYMPDEPTVKAANNMKVSQYMIREVVPLVSDIGDLPAAVDFGEAGYICEADNMAALTTTLLQALEDKDRLKKAARARAFAAQKFSWDILARDLCEWLNPGGSSKKKDGKPKAYVVAATVPGNTGGGEIRNFNLMKQLVNQVGLDVEVFCASPADPDTTRKKLEQEINVRCHVARMRPRSIFIILKAIFLEHVPPYMIDFKSSGMGDMFRAACERSLPDIVQIEQLYAYYCIYPHISWLKNRGVKIVFDCHNIEFRLFEDSLDMFPLPKKILGRLFVSHLKKLEIEAIERADTVLACSEGDAGFLKQYNSQTYVISNGVDSKEFHPTPKEKDALPNIIFMGSVGYPPNGDAVQFYLNVIHPIVKRERPDVTMSIIGSDRDWLESVGIRDVSVKPLGFVEDVRPYLNQAIIGICPVRYGSGTRIKIMTYMAAGLPVVSTPKGAEGVAYANGHDIVIADDAEGFAKAILKFLDDKTYRDEIARNGQSFISKHYDWSVIGRELLHAYQHGLG